MTSGCEMSNDQMSNGNNHAGSKLSKVNNNKARRQAGAPALYAHMVIFGDFRLGGEFVIVAETCEANTLQEGPVAIQKIFRACRRQM